MTIFIFILINALDFSSILIRNETLATIVKFIVLITTCILCYKSGKAEGRQFEHYLQTGKINKELR